MSLPTTISGLSEIAHRYDALFCDAWGVIHNGQSLFPGVEHALSTFRKTRGPVIILTNAPRLSDVIPKQLERLGMSQDAYDGIVTSGDATKATIERFSGKPLYRLGPAKDDSVFEAMSTRLAPLEEAEAIFCTGLIDDLTETPDDYRDLLTTAAARGIPMICANPDKVVKFGDRLIYCAGALGDVYEELGGEVILSGKPYAPIYDLARQRAAEHGLSERGRILAIGDGFQTDILGANRQSIDVAYVADGIYSEQSRSATGVLDPRKVGDLLKNYGVHSQYVMEGLRWE